jgi:hypothetical protein
MKLTRLTDPENEVAESEDFSVQPGTPTSGYAGTGTADQVEQLTGAL